MSGEYLGFSRQELYNGQKWDLKQLLKVLRTVGNMPYYFLWIVRVIPRIPKFHENIPNLSQEIEKNTENVPCPPPPPPQKNKKT